MNVFDIIPSDFFNYLAGNSNNRVYADCLELIHNQYDKEISYRLERSYLRDVLAAFLLENHDAKALSSDLKKLSTSIKKIIEKMNHEANSKAKSLCAYVPP